MKTEAEGEIPSADDTMIPKRSGQLAIIIWLWYILYKMILAVKAAKRK